ncbi:three-helix bundle dimerization domain-containing protein [Saccharopolyspora phatthalungensis]|uniref:three-helix bundle dimerization domain-containing protein n=1 Tax=Saccharopolyspora phatthalungensis TaxID=664693 RepID=UPI000AB81FCE
MSLVACTRLPISSNDIVARYRIPRSIISLDQTLERCVDALAVRFPHLHRDTIAGCLRRCYDDLSAGATVTDHLVPLAQHQAAEHLATLPHEQT